jgi:F0F1-type ATP synthase membrane subunit c/vacuolar-type H+-ATPase subunit K
MADAVNGVISVGRNPRAKRAIQTMVIFNGVLAVGIALAGLAAGLTILLIRI